jgi:hypothetical protein
MTIEGGNDLTRHTSTEMHKKAPLAKSASNIGAFFVASPVENDDLPPTEGETVYFPSDASNKGNKYVCVRYFCV